jgi:hypothetical protein
MIGDAFLNGLNNFTLSGFCAWDSFFTYNHVIPSGFF